MTNFTSARAASPSKAFTLVATTVMTAASLLLAGAMLQARSQWRSYSSLMAEKLVVEAAAEAEAQDFAHRVKSRLRGNLTDTVAGDLVPTGISRESLFSENPFRRVVIRGGVSRTGTGEAPRLFDEPSASEQSEMVASDVGIQPNIGSDDDSLRLPVFWVPSGEGGAGEKPPAQVQLGADDPYGDINSRSSYAAVSSYSKPRKAFFSEGARVGFGNAVSIHSRTFPVSAFTAMSFKTDIAIQYPSSTGDFGRVYSAGEVVLQGSGRFESVTAMKGLRAGVQSAGSNDLSEPASGYAQTSSNEGEEEEKDEGNGKNRGLGIGVGGDPGGAGEDVKVSDPRDLKKTSLKEGRKQLRGVVVGGHNGGMELVRNKHVDNIDNLTGEMRRHIDCDIEFGIFTKTGLDGGEYDMLGIKSGGLRLRVDTQKAVDTRSLRVIDGGRSNYLATEDLTSGKWRRLDGDGSPEGGSAFYAETREGDGAKGGKVYFNPCRLAFLGGDSVKGKPFSIRITVPANWALHVVTERGLGVDAGLPGDGVTIVTERSQDITILGDFITSVSSTPSMIVSGRVRVKSWPEVVTGARDVNIRATVITSGESPTSCMVANPNEVGGIYVHGGVIIWEHANNNSLVPTLPMAPERGDGSGGDLSLLAYRDGLLSGSLAPVLVPVVSEVRINGNAPFTRRGTIASNSLGSGRSGGVSSD